MSKIKVVWDGLMKHYSFTVILFIVVMLVLSLFIVGLNITPVNGGSLIHTQVNIGRGGYEYVDFNVVKDTYVIIDGYEISGLNIDVEIIRPDGTIERPKERVSRFRYSFTATMTGTYRVRLDNSFDIIFSKTVVIAIAIDEPPHTVTTTNTLTKTITNTVTNTVTSTLPITSTYTITKTLATTSTHTVTQTYTTTQVQTLTQIETKINWPITSFISIATLITGLAIGLFILKIVKTK